MARNLRGTKFLNISSEIATFHEKTFEVDINPNSHVIVQVKMDGSDIWASFEVHIINGTWYHCYGTIWTVVIGKELQV